MVRALVPARGLVGAPALALPDVLALTLATLALTDVLALAALALTAVLALAPLVAGGLAGGADLLDDRAELLDARPDLLKPLGDPLPGGCRLATVRGLVAVLPPVGRLIVLLLGRALLVRCRLAAVLLARALLLAGTLLIGLRPACLLTVACLL
ncbi:hypothetical protein, partial [Micromonospora chersina]|uniref:hypothetical protein n=1 Tax=Micromonospora chersina TaxID=47854 RepID=UPI00340168B4